MKLKDAYSLKGKLWQAYTAYKKQRYHFANVGLYSQNYDFSSSHVQMWELEHTLDWAPMKWCFWIVVLEKTLESPCQTSQS